MKHYIRKSIRKNWEIAVISALSVILIIAYFPLINSRLTENTGFGIDYGSDNRALSDRIFYNNVSRETISHNFIVGSGLGTFIFQIDGYLENNNILLKNSDILPKQKQYDTISPSEYPVRSNLEHWEYQPVHNIYLLVCSEIGIVGFVVFCLIIMEIASNSVNLIRKTTKTKDF